MTNHVEHHRANPKVRVIPEETSALLAAHPELTSEVKNSYLAVVLVECAAMNA